MRPDLATSNEPQRLLPEQTFRHRSVSALSRTDRARHRALAVLWAAVNASFWVWWLAHAGHGTPWMYVIETIALFYQVTLLPTVYWWFVGKMRRPVEVKAPEGMRVALITLCVPAHESLEVIGEQLDALKRVEYPHDSWVLDEGGSNDVRALADAKGVNYFSRRGVARWNQPKPPFQEKTKAGNVNAWLDQIEELGLEYDVFVQLDIDHRPRPDYLHRVLGYFRDRRIGWVQAPSVIGNLDNWAARGLAEQDLVFQGPLQMGFYGTTGTPFIIGSHTSYRTSAVREIGGFQPTRAEDHLDTVVLAAHGYRGVFVPELIAVGDGPNDLATYLRQQFAWAYSMVQIFLHHTPRLLRSYSPGQALQFLFAQSWYTLWSVSLALLWALPAIALIIGQPIVSMRLGGFFLYFLPVILSSSLMWTATRKWFQPRGVSLSWRGVILQTARWPVVLWALINVALRITRPYMITPKGVAGTGPRAITVYGPYIGLVAVPLLAVWVFYVTSGDVAVAGVYWIALTNAAMGLVVLATTVTLDILSASRPREMLAAARSRAGVIVGAASLLGLLVSLTVAVWQPMIQAVA
jgi:cellulose synthase/poly-beta-1,6-N-acetylglucosamine synthase-like glycosyltransferase